MVLAIKAWGWRSMYLITGSLGMILFTLSTIFVKNPIVLPEPVDEQDDGDKILDSQQSQAASNSPKGTKKKRSNIFTEFGDAIKQLWTNPTARWVTLGGAARFYEAFAIVYYAPSFYQKAYPHLLS